jgi:MTH538 TIR-like domain (DUF1863)
MSEQFKNIFISHIHEDDADLRAMKDLLGKRGFVVRDSSINSSKPNKASNPEYIKTGILAPQINWAGMMVVLISPGTHGSEWVNWEIEYANKQNKRIVGVWAHGAKDCDVPENLDLYADAVVGWNAERIEDAICGKINNWQKSSGELRSLRSITRYGC